MLSTCNGRGVGDRVVPPEMPPESAAGTGNAGSDGTRAGGATATRGAIGRLG